MLQAGAGLEDEHPADRHRHRPLLGGQRGAVGGRQRLGHSPEGSRPTRRLHSHEGTVAPARARRGPRAGRARGGGRHDDHLRELRVQPDARHGQDRRHRDVQRRASAATRWCGTTALSPPPTWARPGPSASRSPGTYSYHCQLHGTTQNMVGTLTVTADQHPARVAFGVSPGTARRPAGDLHLHGRRRPRRHARPAGSGIWTATARSRPRTPTGSATNDLREPGDADRPHARHRRQRRAVRHRRAGRDDRGCGPGHPAARGPRTPPPRGRPSSSSPVSSSASTAPSAPPRRPPCARAARPSRAAAPRPARPRSACASPPPAARGCTAGTSCAPR